MIVSMPYRRCGRHCPFVRWRSGGALRHRLRQTSLRDLSRVSTSGNYLAARHASTQRDATAASAYYRAALRADPKNSELLDRAFVSVLADGDIEEAGRLAERVLVVNKNDRIARLVARRARAEAEAISAPRTSISRNRCADRSPT